MAVDHKKLQMFVVMVFVIAALASIIWLIVKPSGFAILASIFLSVQAGLLFWMSRLQNKLRK